MDAADNSGAAAPLLIASRHGRWEVARELLARGARGGHSGQPRLRTPLHIASTSGRLEVVRELPAQDFTGDAANRWDATPLHPASMGGHLGAVRELLRRR